MWEARKTPICSPIYKKPSSLVGTGYFSCLDLKAGFWQIAMDDASKQYTVFTMGNLGFFECEHMLFGLCNAPVMFHRLMHNCLDKLNVTYCLIYLDDITVFLKIEEKHLHCLCIVFEHFREHQLKLKLTRCEFFKSKINYLIMSPRKAYDPAKKTWKLGSIHSTPNLH